MDNLPRYVVLDEGECYSAWKTLKEAIEWKAKHGGMIYEPMGMSTTKKILAEKKAMVCLQRLYDCQNGPPLVQDKEEWESAMSETETLLEEWGK